MNTEVLREPGLWIVAGPFEPLATAGSLLNALQSAFELSKQSTLANWTRAPSHIVCIANDERIEASAIMDWWRQLGWLT